MPKQRITIEFVVDSGDTPLPLLKLTGSEREVEKAFDMMERAFPNGPSENGEVLCTLTVENVE